MVEYLSGERIQGSSTLTSAPPQTSWKEIGRTTLSSAGDDITVSSLPDKDNLMLLYYINQSGAAGATIRVNGDTGSNYSWRNERDGTTDTTDTSATYINLEHSGNTTNDFGYGAMSNVSGQETLTQTHSIYQGTAGAGYIPNRQETVGKWAETNTISSLTIHNADAGSYASGSELVVLGCDNDEADSGTNFWQELANVELTSTGDDIDSGTFTAKKYLWVQIKTNKTGSPEGKIQFNNDANANYAERHSDNFGTEYTNINRSWIDDYIMNGTGGGFLNMFIINESSKEKLAIVQSQSNPSGVGSAPFSYQGVFKWANISAQITSIKLFNTHSGDWTAGSSIKVWGSD